MKIIYYTTRYAQFSFGGMPACPPEPHPSSPSSWANQLRERGLVICPCASITTTRLEYARTVVRKNNVYGELVDFIMSSDASLAK